MEKPIRTTAPAASLICLLLLKATLSFSQLSVQSDFKALPANPPELDQVAVPWLPFEEDWSSGLFETNLWEKEQNGNWRIAGQVGNSAPSAEFFYSPAITNYQKALTSRLLNARNLIDGEIYLLFDLKLTTVNPTGLEFLKVQVLTDTTWNTVWAYSNFSNSDWVHLKLDITDSVKGNTFRFRFLAEGQNSLNIYNWMIDNISIYRKCEPPINLIAEYNYPNLSEAILVWEPPVPGGQGVAGWLAWDDGNNHDAIGLTTGGTFSAAVRFTAAQLGQYEGNYLTKIRFFPYAEGSFVLKVWTGENGGQSILTQPVSNIFVGEWNEVALNYPFQIPNLTELWFGYTVTHTSGNFPAGVDDGPAVSGFGDLISLDGSTWESMASAYALNYNWNLEGYIGPLENNPQNYDNRVELIQHANSINKSVIKNTIIYNKSINRNLLHYEIYRDGELRDTTSAITYLDSLPYAGNFYCYTIVAVYADCVSIYSNEDCVIIRNEERSQPIHSYPVPANQSLNIDSENELSSLIITNFNYQPVYQIYNLKPGTITINTSTFGNGIYFIRAIDCAGNIHSSKFIVNH